jgi:peptide/nickel transport system substrate-binding protein
MIGSMIGPAIGATLGQAVTEKLLVFVPQAMPASLDPIATPGFATRTAAMAVFETLYGTDAQLNPMPQMVAGHRMEDSGKRWVFQLRSGLLFHDGTPVTARDCVASLRRWMRADRVGQALAARLEALEATAGDTLTLRLTRPLLRVPAMLAKSQLSPPLIMPERFAGTGADTPVEALIGSGPFRLAGLRWRPGDDLDLIRFAPYQPRLEASSFTAGRRVALLDRVLWRTPDDPLQALRDGAADWVELLPPDLADDALGDPGLTTGRLDEVGNYALLRLNTRRGPTANQAVRQAILAGIDQTAVMETVFGAGSGKFITPVGLFSPGSEFVSTAGSERIGAKKSPRAIRAMLADAGYQGEPLVVLNPVDDLVHTRLTGAVIDELKQIGLTVAERPLDRPAFAAWRAHVQGAAQGAPAAETSHAGDAAADHDGWSALCDSVPGADHFDPLAISAGPAPSGGLWPGWLDDPAAARSRDAWIDTTDLGASRAIAAQLQLRVFTTANFVPLGQWRPTAAWRTIVTGQQKGSFPVFWDIARP